MNDISSSDESSEENVLVDIVINQVVDEEQDVLLLALIEAILDDDNDDIIPTFRGGSIPGKSRNIDQNRSAFDAHLNADYFDNNPTYNLSVFRRRFRMNRSLYLEIENCLQITYQFFTQKADATGLLGISSRQKVTTALRMLAIGCSSDDVDDRFHIAESTMLEILDCFCSAIIEQYGEEFLREPTEVDLARILHESEQKGWPGMLGSIDCMHWKWKNCPKAWAGMYQSGKENAPTIILQAVADSECRIWHHYFGMPGSNNDINVLERSNILHSAMNGKSPGVRFNVNNNEYSMGYWLGDGIYPMYACIVKAYKPPYLRDVDKQTKFTQRQESRRKDIERCFGILQQRWHILTRPCRFWRPNNIDKIMTACIVLHNMIIDDEHIPAAPQNNENITFEITPPANPQEHEVNEYRATFLRQITNVAIHNQLQHDLTEHHWNAVDDENNE